MGLVVVALLVVVVAYVVAYIWGRVFAPAPAPEPKRFGLDEADAALSYVRASETAVTQAVMAVVVGVLGYYNAVAEDVAEETNSLAAVKARRDAKASDDEDKIEALRAEIALLRAANASADQRVAALHEIAEIFRG